MIIRKYILLLLSLCNVPLLAQNVSLNNVSYIHTNFFTGNGGAVSYITPTTDGGFAYISPALTFCAIDSSFTKFDMNTKCYEGGSVNPKYSKLNRPNCKNARSLIFRVNTKGKVQWVKSLYNECYSYDWGVGGGIKQTRDKGFITFLTGRIIKLDSIGNIKWKLYYDRDSIPGIKKTEFLCKASASDIFECSDGSFVALLDASFSLLKISKDGKPMWLKSTVFDEFNAYVYFQRGKNTGKKDSIYFASGKIGGGEYINTYQVYETDDGGYISIGNPDFDCKPYLKQRKKGDTQFGRYFYLDDFKLKIYKEIFPEMIYIYSQESDTLNAEVKDCKSAARIVKTDKNGNVLWSKSFGDYGSWSGSGNVWKKDLIKLANNRWLVRIRDCHPIDKNNRGGFNYGAAHSDFFILDNNGNVLSQPKFGPSEFQCDPIGMELAPDSGYYFYEQDIVSKADKNFCIQWQRKFGGSLTDVGIHAVTADTGVLSTEKGYIYKFDKYGHKPPDKLFIRAVRDDSTTLHLYLEMKDSTKCSTSAKWYDASILFTLHEPITAGILEQVWYMWEVKDVFGNNRCDETYRCVGPGENGILDLNKKEQLNALIIDLHNNEGKFSIEPKGFSEIIIKNIKYTGKAYKFEVTAGRSCHIYGNIK